MKKYNIYIIHILFVCACTRDKVCVVRHGDLLITATLPTPHVSMRTYSYNKEQLWLAVTRPEAYSSGRFILRYDCGFRGIPIELAYSSVDISSSSSDEIVTRSRSCFVVGEISRVTVWFVSGRHISSAPAVVNVNSGEGEIGDTACAACLLTHQRKHVHEKGSFAVEMPTHTT